MGKTTLLDAFVTDAAPPVVVRAACDRFEADLAYSAAGLLLGDHPAPDASPAAVGARLLRVFGQSQRDGRPCAVVLDDVQWLDPQSAAALRFALRRLRADRVLAVLARRPVGPGDALASLLADTALTTVVRLEPLTLEELVVLARAEHGRELDAAAARRVLEATGGVPLWVRSLPLDDTSAQRDVAGPAYGGAGTGSAVPSPATARTRDLLATLEPGVRELLQALAVLDDRVEPVPLGSVARSADMTAAATAAVATGLVERSAGEPGALGFRHSLLREAVYGSLDPVTRRDLHARAAASTSGSRRLGHRVAATDRPDPALAGELTAAGATEAAAGRHGVAANRLLQARAVAAEPPARDELLLRALTLRVRAGDLSGAHALRSLAEDCPPSPLRSLALGLLHRECGEVMPARSELTAAVAAADDLGLTDLAEVAALELAALHAVLNQGAETVRWAARALASSTAPVARTALWVHASGLWTVGKLDEALTELETVRPPSGDGTADDDDVPPELIDALGARGLLRFFAGDLEAAELDLSDSIRLGTARRGSMVLSRSYVQRSTVRFRRGDWDGAAVDASNARALAEEGDRRWEVPLAHALSVHVPAARGQWDVAEEHLQTARDAQARARTMHADAVITAAAVELHLARGDSARAWGEVAPLLEPGPLRARVGMNAAGWIFTVGIEALVRLGELDDARALLGRYSQVVSERPLGPSPARLGWLTGLLAEVEARPTDARDGYARDLEDPALLASPLAHAVTLQAAGRLERALGNRRRAIDLLRTARDLFVGLRADPYRERCDRDLADSGLRQTASSPLALTAREVDVATLVARGLSNPEAASELFVTPKTVEYHLGNIYGKLGISSRRDLRRLLAPA